MVSQRPWTLFVSPSRYPYALGEFTSGRYPGHSSDPLTSAVPRSRATSASPRLSCSLLVPKPLPVVDLALDVTELERAPMVRPELDVGLNFLVEVLLVPVGH